MKREKEGRNQPGDNEARKLYQQMAELEQSAVRQKRLEEGLKLHFVNLAEMVSRIFSLRDPYAGIHKQGAARLARIVGARLGLDKQELQNLYIGGLLYDIGKVAIPEVILAKPGPLTPEEWMLIYTYPRRGYEILQSANLPWPVAEMALRHHEQLDGSGYPDGVRGDKLCREVRIIATCSVVSAMATPRPYRLARSREEIIKEMTRGQGQKYDARVVEILLDIIAGGEPELWGQELK